MSVDWLQCWPCRWGWPCTWPCWPRPRTSGTTFWAGTALSLRSWTLYSGLWPSITIVTPRGTTLTDSWMCPPVKRTVASHWIIILFQTLCIFSFIVINKNASALLSDQFKLEPSPIFNRFEIFIYWQIVVIDWLIDWLIDWKEFYAVSAIIQPCNGGILIESNSYTIGKV